MQETVNKIFTQIESPTTETIALFKTLTLEDVRVLESKIEKVYASAEKQRVYLEGYNILTDSVIKETLANTSKVYESIAVIMDKFKKVKS